MKDYAPKQSAGGKPPRRSPWPRILFAVFFVVFVGGGLYSGYIFYSTLKSAVFQPPSWSLPFVSDAPAASEEAPSVAQVETSPVWKGQERVNILLLGVDQRENEKDLPTRSDTMIVLTLDPATKTAGMLSIPRDLWVAIPLKEVGEERINTAHFFGEYYKLPGGGPALAKKTVSLNLGIPIHFYARVDFRGFEKVIDSIGGINIDVDKPIRDDEYPDASYGYLRLFIPAGLQHMDGPLALQYARSRHSENDFGRIRRQQKVLLALREQGLQLGLVPKLPGLFATLRDSVSTDVPVKDAITLAQLAAQIDVKSITSRSIDETMSTSYITPGGADVQIPNRTAIASLIKDMFYSNKPPAPTAQPTTIVTEDQAKLKEEAGRIEVQNGTEIDGLATKAQRLLEQHGYTVVRVSNAELSNYKDTVLLYYSDNKRYTRDQLAKLFGVAPANVRSGGNPRSDIDFRLIVGSTARLP